VTKDELLKLLTEILEAAPPAMLRHKKGMLSSTSFRRIRLVGDDLRMAVDLAIEIVQATPANRIEQASESIEGRYPGRPD